MSGKAIFVSEGNFKPVAHERIKFEDDPLLPGIVSLINQVGYQAVGDPSTEKIYFYKKEVIPKEEILSSLRSLFGTKSAQDLLNTIFEKKVSSKNKIWSWNSLIPAFARLLVNQERLEQDKSEILDGLF